MIRLILKFFLSILAVALTANIVTGANPFVDLSQWMIVTIVLALLNTLVKPVIKLVAMPLTLLTLGLFSLVINAAIVLLCAHLVEGFVIQGFGQALAFSFVLTLVTWLINKLVD